MGSPKTGPTWRDVSRSVILKKALKTDTNFTLSYKKSRSFFGRHPNKLKNIVLPPLKKIKKVNHSLQQIAYTTTTKIPEKNHIAKFPNILMKNQKYTSKLEKKKERNQIKTKRKRKKNI